MYRYSNGQISLADFQQSVGMNLKESNRWVKKAQTIPWPEIEKRCAALFTNRKGNVASRCVWPWEPASFRRSMAILTRKPPAHCAGKSGKSARNGGAVPSARGALPQPDLGRISAIARRMGSGFPARLWGGPRRVKPETRLRTIGMSASAWKWSADSVWRSVNVAWCWSPQSCGRLRPM